MIESVDVKEHEKLKTERDYYEKLFNTYYKRSKEYFDRIHELQDEIEEHIKFLDTTQKDWEDKWNFNSYLEEIKNQGLDMLDKDRIKIVNELHRRIDNARNYRHHDLVEEITSLIEWFKKEFEY